MRPINPETVLRTERLLLEPLQERHASLLFPLLQDPRIYTYIPQEPPVSLDAMEQRYRRLQSRLSPAGDQAWLNWAVRLEATPEYVGRVEISVLPGATAQLAYELNPASWDKGYATEACRRVLEVIRVDYSIAEFTAQVDTRNASSIRLLERLGFTRVGLPVAADFFKGSASDEYTYRLPCGASA